jgi:hypothetical protein
MNAPKTNIKQMKLEITKLLKLGLDAEAICNYCKVSPSYVREVEEEYIKGLLANGNGHRTRLRQLLLRNTPQMVNVLIKAASQDIDNKLQLSAATTFLNFSTRFFKDDASLDSSQKKISDGFMATTLFDFTTEGRESSGSQGGEEIVEDYEGESSDGEELEVGDFDVNPEDLDLT